jgi:hypothetical protein
LGLFLFSAFRFRVGCDWSGYYNNFIGAAVLDYETALTLREPFWWLVQVAFNKWGLPYPAVNVFTSAIFFIGVHALARRQPDRLGFLVLLFPILIINMPMSGIRQAAAIGFLCLSLVAFIDKRVIRFVAWIVMGAAFHASVLAFLLLTPLATGRYTRWRVVLSLMLALPGAYVLAGTDAAQVALGRYVDTSIEAFGAIFRVGILAASGLFFLLVLRGRWAQAYSADFGLVNVGAWMMLALLPVVGVSTVLGDRFGYYLVPIQTTMFARLPYLQLPTYGRLMSALPYLGLLLVFTVWSLGSSLFAKCYVPYQSWLFGHEQLRNLGF